MTQPQLTIQQLEHAISVYEKRVEAKKQEVEALKTLLVYAPAPVGAWFDKITLPGNSDAIEAAAENLLASKHTVATLDLEEMELQLKAMRQMRSGVVGASRVIDPFKPNQRH